jgi:hypothetical protein
MAGERVRTLAPLLNKNLIVNGDAEMGQGSPDGSSLVSIPGWSRIEQSNVLQYSDSEQVDRISLHDPGPANRGKNYFSGGSSDSTLDILEQIIDVSSLAEQINK